MISAAGHWTDRLRSEAERRLQISPSSGTSQAPDPERDLAHELQVSELELELQHEELQRAQDQIDELRHRYVDLYEEAPVALVAVDGTGVIVAANAAFAALLGSVRPAILRRPLTALMGAVDADAFCVCRQEVLRTGLQSTCDVILQCSGGTYRRVHVVVKRLSRGRDECVCAFVDHGAHGVAVELPASGDGPVDTGSALVGRSSTPPKPGVPTTEARIVVRRRQANGTTSDFAVHAAAGYPRRRALASLLESAGRERGTGVWSDAAPEVWVGDKLVCCLGRETDQDELLRRALDTG